MRAKWEGQGHGRRVGRRCKGRKMRKRREGRWGRGKER